MTTLNKTYWEQRYHDQNTGWDIGEASEPLKTYINRIENKLIKILIPGCGNAYEFDYLKQNGFNDVYVLDVAKNLVDSLKNKNPEIDENYFINEDFFEHSTQYDLILEQTFFCALDPKLRPKYAKKMFELLSTNGLLVGVLFNVDFGNDFPPFGGNKAEYLTYFEPYFNIITMESCYNSIEPRKNKELFIILKKKNL